MKKLRVEDDFKAVVQAYDWMKTYWVRTCCSRFHTGKIEPIFPEVLESIQDWYLATDRESRAVLFGNLRPSERLQFVGIYKEFVARRGWGWDRYVEWMEGLD